MKLSGFLKYDTSKRKISLIAIIPKRSYGLNRQTKINRMLIDEPKISEHNKQNKLFCNSVFEASADRIDFSYLYPPNISRYLNKIKKVSESIQIENYEFSKQAIKQETISKVASYPVFKNKSDITTMMLKVKKSH